MSENLTLEDVIPVLQKLLWADPAEREKLQNHGMNLIPSNFYSSVPSIADITQSYEYSEQNPPYLDPKIFDAEKLRKELIELIPFSEDFNPATEGDEENCTEFFWKNSQFTYCDAMSYYAYIRRLKPQKIVEIGSGFSSLVALEALKANGQGQLTCVEPFPRSFIRELSGKGVLDLKSIRAQDIAVEHLNDWLNDGDILFIDSTHTVKTGSDCLHIYLRLLPYLKKNIYIHVHDIFLPFGMPQHWLLQSQIYWTEQYVLMAWLIDNPRVSVLYGNAYHTAFNPALLDDLMRGRYLKKGASFWLRYNGAA